LCDTGAEKSPEPAFFLSILNRTQGSLNTAKLVIRRRETRGARTHSPSF
jgi:hypothetical protein